MTDKPVSIRSNQFESSIGFPTKDREEHEIRRANEAHSEAKESKTALSPLQIKSGRPQRLTFIPILVVPERCLDKVARHRKMGCKPNRHLCSSDTWRQGRLHEQEFHIIALSIGDWSLLLAAGDSRSLAVHMDITPAEWEREEEPAWKWDFD